MFASLCASALAWMHDRNRLVGCNTCDHLLTCERDTQPRIPGNIGQWSTDTRYISYPRVRPMPIADHMISVVGAVQIGKGVNKCGAQGVIPPFQGAQRSWE